MQYQSISHGTDSIVAGLRSMKIWSTWYVNSILVKYFFPYAVFTFNRTLFHVVSQIDENKAAGLGLNVFDVGFIQTFQYFVEVLFEEFFAVLYYFLPVVAFDQHLVYDWDRVGVVGNNSFPKVEFLDDCWVWGNCDPYFKSAQPEVFCHAPDDVDVGIPDGVWGRWHSLSSSAGIEVYFIKNNVECTLILSPFANFFDLLRREFCSHWVIGVTNNITNCSL